MSNKETGLFRWAARFAAILFMGALLSACMSKMISAPLKVGTSATMAPLVFVGDDGEVTGLEVDFAEQLSDKLKRRIEWREMPFDELLPALERGDIDVVMAGMSVTPTRERVALFTDPYMSGGQMIVFNRSELGRLNSVGAAHQAGVRFAVETGSIAEEYVSETFANGVRVPFSDTEDMILALENNDVDYVVQDAAAIWFYTLGADPKHKQLLAFYRYLTHEPVAWAVHRGNVTLQRELNGVLKEWKESGELQRMLIERIPIRAEL
jgi:ABC-type amino acid transport substrate-binding protein